jgi:hypothetical protein
MIKHKDIFWIKFAGLYCRVTTPSRLNRLFRKYFAGPYITIHDTLPDPPKQYAKLALFQRDGKLDETSIRIKRKKLTFKVYITGTFHFYYPLISGTLQRIFTVLFYLNDGLVFHASSVSIRGKAHVFVGDSGAGKTTMAKLSNSTPGVVVLADNQVFIRKLQGVHYVFPFPFSQYNKDGDVSNIPVAAFYILHKSLSNNTMKLSFIDGLRAFGREIQVINVGDFPSDHEFPKSVRLAVFDLAKSVNIKRLYFLPTADVWKLIHV